MCIAANSENEMSEIDYEKLAGTIAQKLQLFPAPEKILWDATACAHYLSVSERHFVDWLSKQFGFPSPIVFPSRTGGGRGQSRWYAIEITNWVHKQKRAS